MGPIQKAILKAAAEKGEIRPTELARELGTYQPNISKALRILKDRGLVRPPRGWTLTSDGRAMVRGLEG